MKEIVKVLLAEGIDEETIHEVLEILENREEALYRAAQSSLKGREKAFDKAFNDFDKVSKSADGGALNPRKINTVQKYRMNKAASKLERAQDRLNRAEDIIKSKRA